MGVMKLPETVAVPELLFTVPVLVLLLGIALPNLVESRRALRWVRSHRALNGQHDSLVRIAQTDYLQNRSRLLQMAVLVTIGAVFMTQPAAIAVSWRAWFLYGCLLALAASISVACLREWGIRRALLEDVQVAREQRGGRL